MLVNKDLLIIGGGPGGYEIAAEAAKEGRKVTLIERDALGGTCLNRGCIPTKCLCASASAINAVKDAEKFGVEVEGFKLNYTMAAERMRSVTDQLRSGIESLLKDVEVIKGEAVLGKAGDRVAVEVNGQRFTANQLLIATGSKPASLPIEGAELAKTSDDVLKFKKLPESAAIIGGGVIGMEFASIFASFGVETTVIEFCPEILPAFDKEVAKRLRSTLSRKGVKIIVGAAVKSLHAHLPEDPEMGKITVTYSGKKGDESVDCKVAIMAVGRKAVLPQGCEEAGIDVNKRGFIEVDDNMLTSMPDVYAVGDVNGVCMLAHAASAQARMALGFDVDMDYVPSAVFTMPECAMVGLTEEACMKEGIEYAKNKAMFAANGKALAMGESDGFVKVLYSPATRLLLGVHVIGPHAADIIAEATACMAEGATIDSIAKGIIHGHPTLSEAFMSACNV